ncbi:hypothetical protein [Roseofilum casamattae]|uniref:DivIVA domain-containing protein n=1 Tax=Roseofilum casamattae BLCC-M143 TaxID=3022442 RepID=A0ABT7BYV1_9CYAN|nr:hypothetical protein [Roseofilum casamattae]MDJ1184336.1 DivIVA domain-containing protein [Roseofilum casamattae BLCC-M143]
MLQQDPYSTRPERDSIPRSADDYDASTNETAVSNSVEKPEVDIQEELERLKEIILMSSRIPWTRYTFVDEDRLLDQIELIQFHLPKVFEQAVNLVTNREEIMLKAKRYSQDLIRSAEQQAAEILDEMTLVQQAEAEAQVIWQQTLQECQQMKDNLALDLQEMEDRAIRELQEQQQKLLDECDLIQQGADDYADRVLEDLEDRLGEMLRTIRNGRRQLEDERSPAPSASESQ